MLNDIKNSKTLKLAWAEKLSGVVMVVLANMSYFEDSMSAAWFGGVLIVLGIVSNYLRHVTTKPLWDK